MSASALALALTKSQSINAVVGALTFYMVSTGWSAVQPRNRYIDCLNVGARLAAFLLGTIAFVIRSKVVRSASGLDKDGIPGTAYFVFGTFGLLGGGLDVRSMVRGGVWGVHRVARHLWRMNFALLITSISFFNGSRSRVLPESIRNTPVHDVPTILVAVLLIFWLCRVLFSRAYRKRQYVAT